MRLKKEKLTVGTIEDLAKEIGVDYQVLKIKAELVTTIKRHCQTHEISQRKLAAMVAGMSQDRIHRIFTGLVGSMSIDKLVEILSALKIHVAVKTKIAS